MKRLHVNQIIRGWVYNFCLKMCICSLFLEKSKVQQKCIDEILSNFSLLQKIFVVSLCTNLKILLDEMIKKSTGSKFLVGLY